MDPLTLVMLAVLAVLIFFMFRNSRKRQKDLLALQERMVPGAEVMTNFGLFGTLLSIDDEENQVLLETTPGTVLKVHRQTIAKVVTPTEAVGVSDTTATVVVDGEPRDPAARQFGELAADDGAPTRSRNPKTDD